MIFRIKALLVIYLLQTLVPGWIWEEASKFPGLVHHYQVHRQGPIPLSFLDFLSLHYSKSYQRHIDAHDHSELPLKQHSHSNHDCCAFALTIAAIPAEVYFYIAPPPDSRLRVLFPEPQCLSGIFTGSIFQPPKVG